MGTQECNASGLAAHGQAHTDAPLPGDDATVTLYRPVGQAELDLIRANDMAAFPARLSHQPIFYPVTNEAYATQIARDWNTKDEASGFAGYVTRFRIRRAFLERYPLQTAGAREHQEYWIPAEDLDAFNDSLVGLIEVVAEFRGEQSGG